MTVAYPKELIVSHIGANSPTCGEDVPCLTIEYALRYRAKSSDFIKIDNQFSHENKPFIINETCPFKSNLTLKGVNGEPIISSAGYPRFLFTRRRSSQASPITLTVINIWFKGVALANFSDVPEYTYIKVIQCIYVGSLSQSSESPSTFITSSTPINNSSVLSINMIEVNMLNFSSVLNLDGLHLKLNVSGSYFKFSSVVCSSLLSLANILSFNAMISNTTFNKIYIDVSGYWVRRSNDWYMSINNSIFSDTSERECLTGIYGNNGKFVFENTFFSTDVSIVFSQVVFRKCTFGAFEALHPVRQMNPYQILLDGQFTLSNCQVINNQEFYYYVFSVSGNGTFYDCNFINNTSSKPQASLLFTTAANVLFKNCNFTNNSCDTGTVNLLGTKSIFERCSFLNNKGTDGGAVQVRRSETDGGAVPVRRSFVSSSEAVKFIFCVFENNSAVYVNSKYKNRQGGIGGAISVKEGKSPVKILHCSFRRNTAKVSGGAINHAGGDLIVKHTSFLTSPAYHDQFYAGGDAIFSTSSITLKHVSIHDVDDLSSQNSLIAGAQLFTRKNVTIKCFVGKQIKFYGSSSGSYIPGTYLFNNANIFCSSCSEDKYGLSFGNMTFTNNGQTGFQSSPVRCLRCPFGGVCKKGRIHAAENFWGYITKSKQVQFIVCPFGYCCSENTCINYNSCHVGRVGVLCASCRKGLTENMMTNDYLEPKKCRHSWIWFLLSLVGIVYFLIFLYWREVVRLAKIVLLPKGTSGYFERTLTPENERPLLHSSETTIETNCQSVTVPESEIGSSALVSGLFAIVVNFYQTNVLYKVYVRSENSQNFLQITQEILSAVFNLRADGLFYRELT